MRITARVTTFALATVFCASLSSSAQVADAAGHYEGDISSPAGAMTFQVDLSKGPNGEWLGTLTIPFQKLKGFPLSNVTVIPSPTRATFAPLMVCSIAFAC